MTADRPPKPCRPETQKSFIRMVTDGRRAIRFLPCGIQSFHRKDIAEGYCAHCHAWIAPDRGTQPGYYYEHVDGSLHWKPDIVVDTGGGPGEYFDSPFVKRWWRVLAHSERPGGGG